MLERLGDCNQATMGERFDLDKTTLSRNLKLLQARGWVEVTRGADARERRVALTTAGRQTLAEARPAWRRAQAHLRSGLDEHDWDTMLRVLDGVTRAARKARRPKSPAVKDGPRRAARTSRRRSA
jgi:DNA-binding MarR family transcriptional regulator